MVLWIENDARLAAGRDGAPTDDAERLDRRFVDTTPDIKEQPRPELVNEGKLFEARKALRRVLARRGFSLTPEQEALIEGCGVLLTLERWLDDAVTAASVESTLR